MSQSLKGGELQSKALERPLADLYFSTTCATPAGGTAAVRPFSPLR
jgi:hypothetical protein